jgi:hypothetical protein
MPYVYYATDRSQKEKANIIDEKAFFGLGIDFAFISDKPFIAK